MFVPMTNQIDGNRTNRLGFSPLWSPRNGDVTRGRTRRRNARGNSSNHTVPQTRHKAKQSRAFIRSNSKPNHCPARLTVLPVLPLPLLPLSSSPVLLIDKTQKTRRCNQSMNSRRHQQPSRAFAPRVGKSTSLEGRRWPMPAAIARWHQSWRIC